MVINLDLYRRSVKRNIKYYMDNNPKKGINGGLALADTEKCHIIAVGYYIAELYGFSEELRARLDSLEKYYSYPEIINFKPDNP